MTPTEFGERLKTLRIQKNIMQQEMADALRIHRNIYGRWERGMNVNLPNDDLLSRMALVLDVSPESLKAASEFTMDAYTKEEQEMLMTPDNVKAIKAALAKITENKLYLEANLRRMSSESVIGKRIEIYAPLDRK